jgi:protein gp37
MGKTTKNNKSLIDWCDVTWEVTAGCSKVSAGCKNCWAIRTDARLQGAGFKGYEKVVTSRSQELRSEEVKTKQKSGNKGLLNWTGKVNLLEHNLQQPFGWRKPRRVFVNSRSDLFHPDVPFEYVDRVMTVIAMNPQHTFMILTKRPERMKEYFESRIIDSYLKINITININSKFNFFVLPIPILNLWLGVSVEDQKTADERIPILLEIPAAKHFISLEPMLGPVDLSKYLVKNIRCPYHPKGQGCGVCEDTGMIYLHNLLDWVIVGGESGPGLKSAGMTGARPMHPEWVRSINVQCTMANVQFYFKQWGSYSMLNDKVANVQLKSKNIVYMDKDGVITESKYYPNNPDTFIKVGKKKAGHLLDGKEYRQIPDSN